MRQLILNARAAAMKIQVRHCCYARIHGQRGICDCKYLTGPVLGGAGSEQTGCAEASGILYLLDDLLETGSYDPEKLKDALWRARQLRYACCDAIAAAYHATAGDTMFQSAEATVTSRRSSRSLTMTMIDVHAGTDGEEDGDGHTVVSGSRERGRAYREERTALRRQVFQAECTAPNRRPSCGCSPITDSRGGSGCYEAAIIKETLKAVPDHFPARVKDKGVQARLTMVAHLTHQVKFNIKALVAALARQGGDSLRLLTHVCTELKRRDENDPILVNDELQRLIGDGSTDGDDQVELPLNVFVNPLPSIPGVEMRLTVPLSQLAALVLEHEDGKGRFFRANNRFGKYRVETLNVPESTTVVLESDPELPDAEEKADDTALEPTDQSNDQ